MIRFIELFSGIGGFRLGLERASFEIQQSKQEEQGGEDRYNLSRRGYSGDVEGANGQPEKFHCVWSNDNDKYACQIYRKQFGDGELHEGDIRAADPSIIPEHDLLTAGFPCQSFSIAGKRGGFEDTRGTLFFEICRILRAKRPGYVWLENVKGLLSHDDGTTFQTIIRTLDDLGYDCQWQVLNSKDYGVPQNRERVFIVGHLRGQPGPKIFPIGEAGKTDKELRFLYGVMSEDVSMWLEDGKKFSRNYPQGQRVYDSSGISAQINAQAGGWGAKTGLYEVPTIRAEHHNTADVHYLSGIRRLTPLECERLQGFPDGWTEVGIEKGKEGNIEEWLTGKISDTQRYKCLGNAVTVNVIEAIGSQMVMELCQ